MSTICCQLGISVSDGAVLSCGNGFCGQLGQGHPLDEAVPKVIAAAKGRSIVQVAAGHSCSLLQLELCE